MLNDIEYVFVHRGQFYVQFIDTHAAVRINV